MPRKSDKGAAYVAAMKKSIDLMPEGKRSIYYYVGQLVMFHLAGQDLWITTSCRDIAIVSYGGGHLVVQLTLLCPGGIIEVEANSDRIRPATKDEIKAWRSWQ